MKEKPTLIRDNVAIIWQPHYNSKCFRANIKKQRGVKKNIVVVCTGEYSGVWEYNAENLSNYEKRLNGDKHKIIVVDIPISDCTKIQNLEDMRPENKAIVRKEQLDFCKAYRQKEQPWVLKI